MFTNLKVWEEGIAQTIQDDLDRSNVSELDDNDPKKAAIINNVLLAHTITFCHNMVEFGMKVNDIKQIVDNLIKKYKLNETSIQQIQELMKKELEGKI